MKDKVFEGGGSGQIYLDENHLASECISNKVFDIPAGESFLELNYKCSVPFVVGLYNTLNNNVDVFEYLQTGVKPSDTWKKIYLELGSYTSKYPGKNYKLLIQAVLPEGQANGYVLLDNVKVVTF